MFETIVADDVQASTSPSPTTDLVGDHHPKDRIRVDFERFEKRVC
jgi:hypothetical protein